MLETQLYTAFRKFKHSNMLGLRSLINQAYYDPRAVTIPRQQLDYVVIDDCKFYPSDQLISIRRTKDNPQFANIRPDDIAVDIGANIGAVTIPLAKMAKYVWAYEPLFYNELLANIRLNGLTNVTVMPCGLGMGEKSKVAFSSKEGVMDLLSFEDIKCRAGRIDFLKCDCEGYEWDSLQPEMVKGIRELRLEFHLRWNQNGSDNIKYKQWKRWLTDNGYEYDTDWSKYPLFSPFYGGSSISASLKEKK